MPVLLIDGNADATVLIGVSDTSQNYDFGYISEGLFKSIVPASPFLNFKMKSFSGGDLIDFAIQDVTTDAITCASEGTAEMVFSGVVPASNSANPVVSDDYWQSLTISWSLNNNDMVINLGGQNDGFAPAPVPEPNTLLLICTGIIGIAGWGRKKFIKTTDPL